MDFADQALADIDALVRSGRFKEAQALVEGCAARVAGRDRALAQLRYLEGKILRNLGAYEEAERGYLESALAFDALGDRESAADARSGAALVRWHLCDFARATRLQLEAMKAYEASGDLRGAANSENTLGLIAWKSRDFEEAESRFGRALDRYEALSNEQGLAATLNNLGGLAEDRGDLAASERYYRQAAFHYGKSGDRAGVALARGNLAWVLARVGEASEAAALAGQALEGFEGLGDPAGYFRALMQLGQALRSSGRPRRAAATLYRAAHGAKCVGNAELEAVTIEDLIEVLGELGLHARIGAWYRRLMRLERGFLSLEREREILRLRMDFEDEAKSRRNRELERALAANGRGFATVCHDARGAMARIEGALAALGFELPLLGEAGLRSRLAAVEDQARRAREDFEAAMAWARAGAGCLEAELEDLELGPVVEERVAAAGMALAARGMTARLAPCLGAARARADRRLLRIVLGNMLANAIEHGAAGSPLAIGIATSPEGHPVLELANQAPVRPVAAGEPGELRGFGLDLCADLARRMGGGFDFVLGDGRALARLRMAPAEGGSPST